MEQVRNAIAKNIIELRKKHNMTQAELAEKLNYSDKAVSKWERAESIPDVSVLKAISDIFNVTVDYLLTEEHDDPAIVKKVISKRKQRNRALITGISVLLVWFIATFIFIQFDIIGLSLDYWLAYVYAVPVSFVVWLIFNSVWFNPRRNFLIISLLTWSVLITFYLTALTFGHNLWIMFLIGIPAQAIIVMWSGLRSKKSYDWSKFKLTKKNQ
ncbi:MAG: helix-turn-helix transcriptional regulator [Clostridia bacterium]|nr:helix-turn-helix transcriptional regulator [Clostridia bacterium]